MTTTEDPNPNSTPPEGSSGPVSAPQPVDGARDAETGPGPSGGREAVPEPYYRDEQ